MLANSRLFPCLLVSIVSSGLIAPALAQRAVGVVVDRGLASTARPPMAHVFDPDTLAVRGSVTLPTTPQTGVFDVEIAPDLSEAYIGDNDLDQVWIVNLLTNPPSLSAGINPIQLHGGTLDLSLTPDGRYLLAASGSGLTTGGTSLAIVDLSTRLQTSEVVFNPTSPVSVEVAHNGSVLIADIQVAQPSYTETNVRRFRIDHHGVLTDTGDLIGVAQVPGVQDMIVPHYPFLPNFLNTLFARHVVHVSRPAGGTMGSLRLRGLAPVASVALDNPTGIDLSFDPYRSIVYVRTNDQTASGPAGVGPSQIDGYFFSPFTGRFGPRVVSIELDRRAGTAYGVEQTAVDPATRRLFVSGLAGPEVRVFDSITGVQTGSVTTPDLIWALGIAVRRR